MTALYYEFRVATDNQDGPVRRHIQFADQELDEAKLATLQEGGGEKALWGVSCHSAVSFDSKYIFTADQSNL